MAPPKLSYGLNLPNKKPQQPNGPPTNLAAGQKRKKTIFDDSDSEGERDGKKRDGDDGAVEITTLGGLDDLAEQKPTEPSSKEPPSTSTKPPAGNPSIKPLKNSIFADEDDEKEEGEEDTSDRKKKPQFTGTNKDYTNLAAMHTSNKYAKEAEQIDPSIYSYDAVYDSIKAQREKKPAGGEKGGSGGGGGSRYMEALLRSAEIRKRDQLRARDRKLAREREAEGDEYADKEKFVTAAYRAQQEEIRRMEEEEARREKEEEERRRRNGGAGMVDFYRDMLARGEAAHGEAVKAAQEAARKVQAGEIDEKAATEEEEPAEKTEAQLAAELNARGANIILNDEGQVVDKRQLLSAGLNVAPKAKAAAATAAPSASAAASRPGTRPAADAAAARKAQRARQTELLAAQLEERARQAEEEEAARQRELAERSRSKKTEVDVASARERYLARKREREAQAKAGGS